MLKNSPLASPCGPRRLSLVCAAYRGHSDHVLRGSPLRGNRNHSPLPERVNLSLILGVGASRLMARVLRSTGPSASSHLVPGEHLLSRSLCRPPSRSHSGPGLIFPVPLGVEGGQFEGPTEVLTYGTSFPRASEHPLSQNGEWSCSWPCGLSTVPHSLYGLVQNLSPRAPGASWALRDEWS